MSGVNRDEKITIENAEITGAELQFDRDTWFCAWIYLKYATGGGQGFGGYVFGNKGNMGSKYGCTSIMQIMEVVGVDKWSDLEGKCVRVKLEGSGFNKKIMALGNFMRDEWFSPSELAEKCKEIGDI